ncbi:MAG: nickel pincer cofactor biosynthesis protein LarB [candidate division Zixibacteria bacterium]|nr:nickel pincer cofactor biosynthesis protein LarB [candidate division Zixibacteria bacterium]
MKKESLEKILNEVRDGKLAVDEALRLLKTLPYEDLGFAKIDTHRDLRRGFPEVIFCQGKTVAQIVKIVEKISHSDDVIMASRANREIYEAIRQVKPGAVYFETARIVLIGRKKELKTEKEIAVISAGTSDIPVSEEAAVTAEIMGNPVERIYDIGVAGVHRVFHNQEKIFRANVLVVVAGMEGALASVIGGLVDRPVIAVPTSVGYGASFDGLAALLSMLNSCAPGVVTVNIDNGFGAGYFASLINQTGNDK